MRLRPQIRDLSILPKTCRVNIQWIHLTSSKPREFLVLHFRNEICQKLKTFEVGLQLKRIPARESHALCENNKAEETLESQLNSISRFTSVVGDVSNPIVQKRTRKNIAPLSPIGTELLRTAPEYV